MVDTARTITDLMDNFFQDGQPANSITAQDMRDLIESLRVNHGDYSINAPAATTITVAGTYYKAAGTTTEHGGSYKASMPADNRIRYDGVPDRYGVVMATVVLTCASSNQTLGVKIAKNGVVVDASVSQQRIGTGTDEQNVSLQWHGSVSTNDYFEIWVTNETSTGAVTASQIHMHFEAHADT